MPLARAVLATWKLNGWRKRMKKSPKPGDGAHSAAPASLRATSTAAASPAAATSSSQPTARTAAARRTAARCGSAHSRRRASSSTHCATRPRPARPRQGAPFDRAEDPAPREHRDDARHLHARRRHRGHAFRCREARFRSARRARPSPVVPLRKQATFATSRLFPKKMRPLTVSRTGRRSGASDGRGDWV